MFNGDISRWDVSRVTDMSFMFWSATSFNGDISEWDVSSTTNMDHMFMGSTSFKHQLCGATWVNSKASKMLMFEGSPGSISSTVCRGYFPQRWLARWQVASTAPSVASPNMACSQCGTFTKSGRVSCCAPGGAWYKHCGGVNNKTMIRSWVEGVEACKCKS